MWIERTILAHRWRECRPCLSHTGRHVTGWQIRVAVQVVCPVSRGLSEELGADEGHGDTLMMAGSLCRQIGHRPRPVARAEHCSTPPRLSVSLRGFEKPEVRR